LSKGIKNIIKLNKKMCEHVKEISATYFELNKLPQKIRNNFNYTSTIKAYQIEIYNNLHYIYDNDVLDVLKNEIKNNNPLLKNINEEYINKHSFYMCNISKFYNIIEDSTDAIVSNYNSSASLYKFI
jgi:hypothetical protein